MKVPAKVNIKTRENLQDIESEDEFEEDELGDVNQRLPEMESHERAVTSLKL